MSRLFTYVAAGLAAGSLYALVALGLVLIHRCTRVLNFAHGEVAALGAFVAFTLASGGRPFWIAALAGVAVSAAVAVVFYLVVLEPAQRRGVGAGAEVILTLGLALLLQGATLELWGAEPQRMPLPVSDTGALSLGPARVGHLALATLFVSLAAAALLFLVVERTRLGLAMRALADNANAGRALGLPVRSIHAFAWGLASALAAVAGIMLSGVLLLDPFFMLEPALKGFAAAVLGGLSSLPGAVAGGLLLGVAESLAGASLGVAQRGPFSFAVIVAVLLVRPEGLFGRGHRSRPAEGGSKRDT
jgi:branched-chain amino acid transport system permease protein